MTPAQFHRLRKIGAGLVTTAVQDHPDAMTKLGGVHIAGTFSHQGRTTTELECYHLSQACERLSEDCLPDSEGRDLLLDAQAIAEAMASIHRCRR